MLTGAERKWLDLAGDLLATPLVELPVATIAGELTDAFRSPSVPRRKFGTYLDGPASR